MQPIHTADFKRGFSLIEVLVSAAIMASGLAGLAALLLSALTGTARAADHTAAAMLADAMLARVQLSPTVPDSFIAAGPASGLDCTAAQACSAAQFAAAGLGAWQQAVARELPGGQGQVCLDDTPFDGSGTAPACDGGTRLVVKVFWSASPGPTGQRLVRLVY